MQLASARSRRGLIAGGGLALASLVMIAPTATALPAVSAVTLTPSATQVTVGDPLALTIDLAGASDLYAYDVTLAFDPALATFVDAETSAPEGGFDSTSPQLVP